MKKYSTRNDPFLQGLTPLQFDDYSEEELLSLTPHQASDLFLSDWQRTMRPLSTYAPYFKITGHKVDIIFKHVKSFYRHFVVDEGWDDDKFTVVLDAVLVTRSPMSKKSFESRSKLYDAERLPLQIAEKRKRRSN